MSKVKIIMDRNRIKTRVKNAWKDSMPELSMQILKDCNYYCRQDQGQLIKSAKIHSDFQKGLLVWSTEYARKVYFTGHPSSDVNRNASLMWCRVAKNKHSDEWEEIGQKLFTKGMGK